MLTSQKGRRMIMLPLHQAALSFFNALPLVACSVYWHQQLLLRLDSNQYSRIQKPVCYHYITQQAAVRTGVEPISTDRQSVMLTVTPTNRYSCNRYAATMFSRVCTGGQARTDNRMIPDHGFYPLKYSCVHGQRTFRKSCPCCISQGTAIFLLS